MADLPYVHCSRCRMPLYFATVALIPLGPLLCGWDKTVARLKAARRG